MNKEPESVDAFTSELRSSSEANKGSAARGKSYADSGEEAAAWDGKQWTV